MDETFECFNCGAELEFGDDDICQDCEEEESDETEYNLDYAAGLEYAGKIMRHLNGQTQAYQDGFTDNFDY